MEESGLRAQRLAKLEALRAAGLDPYVIEKFDRTHEICVAIDGFRSIEDHGDTAEDLGFFKTDGVDGPCARLAGRLVSHRPMGKIIFGDLIDDSGRIQVYARREDLGDEDYARFKDLDIGDILGVEGFLFRTRSGEITLHIRSYQLLAKCLRPLPIGKEKEGEHFSGLSDVELRYRMRYVDLLANPEAKEVLRKRSEIIWAVRSFLDENLFTEVETPVLQVQAGGAAARPFKTHHNALDYDFKLRISLELYLKRLIVGGFDRVYEIGRVFRNEGISIRHNPEFTLLELYQAFANLEDIMELVEQMYLEVAQKVNGSPAITYRRTTPEEESIEEKIDLSQRPWKRLKMLDGIAEYARVLPHELESLEAAKAACERVGIPSEKETTVGGIIEKLHERFTQPNLIQPTFITDFPLETSPLAKKRPDNPNLTRRFEVYIATQELGNAFSEINDPIDQRERFEGQEVQRAMGDEEAHPLDEDFIRALEYGMPPTGGLGIGIDRMVMVLTGAHSIRDVILFPLMRPEKS